jgi:carbamoyltransferase
MIIVGISAYFHDSAVAFLINGEIKFAAHEERYSRIKHDSSFPILSIKEGLISLEIDINDIDYFVYFEKPILKFERILDDYFETSPFSFSSFNNSIPVWIKEKIFTKSNIQKNLKKLGLKKNKFKNIKFSQHHLSHMASAYYPSNFQNSAILTIDGVGEKSTTCIGIGNRNKIEIIEQIEYPNSIGLLYSAFTQFLGFKVNSGEYKIMGLAPYGEPKYTDIILSELIHLNEDGSYSINQNYFNYRYGNTMINKRFEDLFELRTRSSDQEITNKHMDIANSIQKVTEIACLKLADRAKKITKSDNLCLAGGVALNCVSNTKIYNANIFKNIWIQPASGDAGTALGAALYFYHQQLGHEKLEKKKFDVYCGSKYSNEEIKLSLNKIGIKDYHVYEDGRLVKNISQELNSQKIVGWFQDKMEFGPRALGSRSIIADPRPKDMQVKLNLKIKFRESFRPFAPAILKEKVSEYFQENIDNPYMLFICNLIEKHKSSSQFNYQGMDKLKNVENSIPSVTHVDNTARVQTVSKEDNKLFYELIYNFNELTGIPMLINTSFNIRGEPIVASPEDAIKCFLGTNIDILVLQNYVIYKNEIPPELINNKFKDSYEKD